MNIILGNNLRSARFRCGWSQSRVSSQTGISIRTISRAENGGGISLKLLKRLCRLYQVPINTIYIPDGVENMYNTAKPEIELLSVEDIAYLLRRSSFVSDFQGEVVMRFWDVSKKEVLFLREEVEDIIKETVPRKKYYQELDLIWLGLEVNRRTIERLNELIFS